MNIEVTIRDAIALVEIEGNLDTNTSGLALERINELIADGTARLLIDLTKVGFVSSAGLRVLLATVKRLGGSGGTLRVCGLNDAVNEVFEISGFNTILEVFPTRDDALRGL